MRTALALATLLLATPAAAEMKIGYVDLQRALNEVDEGRSAQASLKREVEEKQKQLDKDKTDIDRMQAEFEKQAAVLSEEAKRDKAIEIQKRMAEAQGRLMGFQKDLAEREHAATRAISDKMKVIIQEIAATEAVDFVFDKNAGLVVAPASLDLTNELIRKYNARHQGGGLPDKAGEKKGAPKADKKAAAPKAEKKKDEPKKADAAK